MDELESNALKTITRTDDELRVGNYIVVFGGRDLTGIALQKNRDGSLGEYFTPETELESYYTKTNHILVDWEHGQDPDNLGITSDDELGYVDWKTAKKDERGVFVERVLNRRNQYIEWLEELIDAGLIGNSSQTVIKGMQRADDGRITKWPIRRDTLTVNPMEPRMLTENALAAAKALADKMPALKSLILDEAKAADRAAPISVEEIVSKPKLEVNMELTAEEIKAIAADAAKSAVEEYRKSEPATVKAGISIVKDEADQPFESLGQQLQAIKNFATSSGRVMDVRLNATKQLGMNEGLGSEGGFAVQQDFTAELLKGAYATGVLASRVSPKPVSGNANGMSVLRNAETSRVTGSRYGGLNVFWLGEAGTNVPSMPALRREVLDLKKLVGMYYATDELMQDAAALQANVNEWFTEEYGWMLDAAIFSGPGGGQPLGILPSPATIAVARTVAGTISHEDIVNMWSRMLARYRGNAIWVYNQDCEPALYTMGLAVGVAGIPSFMPPGGLSGAPYASLMGRPAIPMEQCSTLGALGDIAVIDPGQYSAIDKGGIQAATSIHVAFLTFQQAFRFAYRFDGQPKWIAPLTPATGSANTLSPFVTLAV